MDKTTQKTQKRVRRHARIRAKVSGTADRPRLSVYRSNSAVYAQLVDDTSGKTLAAADTRAFSEKGLCVRAQKVGEAIAEHAAKKGIVSAVFDRGGFLFAGAIRAVAEGAREKGLAL